MAVHTVSVNGEDRSLLFRILGRFDGGALLLLHETYVCFLPVFGTNKSYRLLIDLILPLDDALKPEDILCLRAPRLDLRDLLKAFDDISADNIALRPDLTMHHLEVCAFQSISLHGGLVLALKLEDHLCLRSGFFVKDFNCRFASRFTFLNQSSHDRCEIVHLILKRQDLLLGLSYQIQ